MLLDKMRTDEMQQPPPKRFVQYLATFVLVYDELGEESLKILFSYFAHGKNSFLGKSTSLISYQILWQHNLLGKSNF
uniref:Uncharacterized protein n=1 Tax=Romanomermis culicivorax TaxID=13658 RepID=A0A915KWC3_ROMCU